MNKKKIEKEKIGILTTSSTLITSTSIGWGNNSKPRLQLDTSMSIPSLLSKYKICANNSFEVQKMSNILTSLWCIYINTQCIYIGQSSNPYKTYKQHAHMLLYKMKNDVMKY
jgi:hypothetical protein